MEVVVIYPVEAGAKFDVFGAIEIVDFGETIFFTSDIFLIGFVEVDSEGLDVLSTVVDVLEVVEIDAMKAVVGVNVLDASETIIFDNVELIMSNVVDLEFNSVDSESVVIVLEVIGALEILVFEWKDSSVNSSPDSAVKVEEGFVPEVDGIEVVDVTLVVVFGVKSDTNFVDGLVVEILDASVINTIFVEWVVEVVGLDEVELGVIDLDDEVNEVSVDDIVEVFGKIVVLDVMKFVCKDL